MKYFLRISVSLLLFLFLGKTSIAQNTRNSSLAYRYQAKLDKLLSDSVQNSPIVINEEGILVKGDSTQMPEFAFEWSMLGNVKYRITQFSDSIAYEFYQNYPSNIDSIREGIKGIPLIDLIKLNINSSSGKEHSLSGKTIVLDPGHFSDNLRTAIMEDKYVLLDGPVGDVDKKKVGLIEAQLNMRCALLVKDMLEERGAEVLLSHQPDKTAFGVTFYEWYSHYSDSIIAEEIQEGWYHTEADYTSWDTMAVMRNFFKALDLRKRTEIINQADPDIVLIMHFNIEPFLGETETGSMIPSERDFAMAFVPGSFYRGEFSTSYDRYLLLRILLSDDWRKSVQLCQYFIENIEKNLGVQAVKKDNEIEYLNKYCEYISGGVYARNLHLTRTVHAPLIYGEPLIYNNRREANALMTYDCEYDGKPVSCRMLKLAEAYVEAVEEFYKR